MHECLTIYLFLTMTTENSGVASSVFRHTTFNLA